ncbi:CASP-like protein 5C1, partial [Cucurbita argyrosperma subsp. sororia]
MSGFEGRRNGEFVELGIAFTPALPWTWYQPGSVGTGGSFSLRLGQTLFSSASLLFMSLGIEFYSYTAFCYLVTVMGLVIPWSFTLALVDGYSVLVKCPLRQPGILTIIIVGDWVLSLLTLAAAARRRVSSTYFFIQTVRIARQSCAGDIKYLLPWPSCHGFCLDFASSLFNLWLLPSL